MNPYLVDTNILSYAYKRDTRAEPYIEILTKSIIFYNFQTLAELKYWSVTSNWDRRKWQEFEDFLSGYTLVPQQAETTTHWVTAMNYTRPIGRKMFSADAWIAATALELGVPLVTHNQKDFFGIEGLEIVSFEED